MSENIETPNEKPSILTDAMLRAKNKLTRETVPNEDANKPKKTLKTAVAFGLGVVATVATLYAASKLPAAKDEMEDSSEETTENLDA
jgi:hypothetical protein